MSYTEIIFEKKDRIATITLNRLERLNAFTWTMGLAGIKNKEID